MLVSRNNCLKLVVLSILSCLLFSYSLANAPISQTGLTVGDACTVTSGDNKGKKGTITHEEGEGYWCEGDWGGTQCADSKCKTSKITIRDMVATVAQPINQTMFTPVVATPQALQCSDDGRLCFDCHYDTNGKLLYCDVIVLPPVRQPAVSQLFAPMMRSTN